MNLWNQKVGQTEEEQETSSTTTEKSNKDKLLDSWNNTTQTKEQQEQPQIEQPEINRTNLIINDEEEDQGLLGIAWDSAKSGVVRTGAGLMKFLHETNYSKNTYKDVIKEYGSIEKAMEAEDPRALLAQRYETQDGEVIEGTENLMKLSDMLAPNVEQDVFGALREKRWEDFIEGAVSGVASNIPDLAARGLLTAGTGNPWLATTHIFGSVAGQKMIELEDNTDFTDSEKTVLAGLNGSIEYLAESLGTGKYIGKLINKIGMKPAQNLVFRALKGGLQRFYKEGKEEYFTEWIQKATDYIFSKAKGLDVEWDWGVQNRQANNAGLLGGLTGLAMGGAGEVLQTTAPNVDTDVKTQANQDESSFNTKFILKETGDRTFDKRVEFVDNMISTGTKYAQELGLDPRMVVALMGHESNFRHIKAVDKSSSAFGALQMNDGAMKTVMQNYELQNDPDSVEGRIEAGVKYLHWIKENYGFTGDALVASYYAGAGEIRKNGIHNRTIYEGSASPQEYLNEFHNMLEIINQSMNQEAEVETEAVVEEESNLMTPESEQWLSQYFEDEMNNIELKDEQGQWTDDALSEFARIREEYGNPNDPVFTNNSGARFTPEFKKALSESLQDKVEKLEELGQDPNSTKAPELLKVFQKEGVVAPKVETKSYPAQESLEAVEDRQDDNIDLEKLKKAKPLKDSEGRYYFTRIDKADADLNATSRPQGLYGSIVYDLDNPSTAFSDVDGDTLYRGTIKADKPLIIEEPVEVQHERFKSLDGSKGTADAGVSALSKLIPQETFSKLLDMNKEELVSYITQEIEGEPNIPEDADAYDVLSIYGAMKAREAGYDAIINEEQDIFAKDTSEIVALNEYNVSYGWDAGTPTSDVEVDNQEEVQDEQGQQANPEQIREVLRASEEEAYEKGIFKEGNREVIERNNTLIAENTVKQHDPITDNGSPSFEINNSEVYYDMIVEAKKNNDFGAFVDESNPEDLAGKRLFVYNGGAMGFALEPDGNITNVFKNTDLTTEKGTGHEMLMKALAEGGNRLDFFNGFLTKLYTSHGFIPVAKTDFVDEFAPEGWNYERDGRPPVVFAVHNGDSLETVQKKYESKAYEVPNVEDIPDVPDYDAGKEAQEKAYESGVELLAVQREYDSIEDKRTSRARELKQKIRDLEFIREFEKTDESIDEAYKRIEQKLEQVEDKRTKEGRELKAKLHALKEYTMRQMDKAVEDSTEKSSSKDEGTDTVKIRTEINEELKQKAQEYIRLKAKEGVEVTEEEAVRLMTFNKPANGNAINTTVIETDNPEILKLIDEVAQILKGESEETFKNIEADAKQSFNKEGQRLERELGLIAKDAKVLAKVMQKAPSVVFRFQHLVSKSAEQVTETAKELNATMSTLSELELANFAKQVQAHFSLTNDLLDIKSGWGRTGVAMKHRVNGKMVDVDTIDPRLYENDLDAQSKVRASIDTLGGAKKLKQMIRDIADGNYDLEGLNQKVRESTNKKITRAILENMSISVLGQWKTHIANILSQASFTIYQNMINYSQASANLLIKEESAMDFAKANAYLIASVKGFTDAFVNPIVSMNDAGKAMFGEDLSAIELAVLAFKDSKKFEAIREASGLTSRAQVELQRTHSLDMDTLFGDKGKNTPVIKHLRLGLDYINSFRRNTTFGLLQAGDKPFASAGYHAQLSLEIIELQRSLGDTVDGIPKTEFLEGLAEKALATRKIKQLENVIEYRILKEAGTESEEAQDALRRKIYSELTGGVLDQVTPFEMEILNRIDQKAIQHSDEMTWKDEFEDGTFLKNAEQFLNAHPMGKILGFLFFHTPMKILQRAQKDTVSLELLPNLMGKNGKKAQVEALGTTAVTYGIIGMSALLYLTNGMTGTPRDKKERELMKQAGVPENSIKINGKWLSFNRLEPMGYLLSLGANGARALHEALEDPDVDNAWMKAGKVFGEVFASMAQTMMNKSSLTGVLRTVNMLVNGGGYGYMKGVLESNDPLYSVRKNITDISYGGLNPFFNENYVEDAGVMARDMFGKPIVKYDSLTQMNPTEPTSSPVRQEIYDLQLKLSGFGNVFNGVKLTDQQRNEILRYFDEVIEAEKQMNNYVNSPSYKNLSSPQKRLALERYWNQLKSQAQMQMMRDSRFMKEYKELQKEEQDKFLNDKEYSETMFRDGDKFKKVKDIIERINLFKRGD